LWTTSVVSVIFQEIFSDKISFHSKLKNFVLGENFISELQLSHKILNFKSKIFSSLESETGF